MATIHNKSSTPIKVKYLGLKNYEGVWEEMKRFTAKRTQATADELWILQHQPVFTLGRAGKSEHLLFDPSEQKTPVVKIDRGGQVTYHGPGQLIIYFLLDLHRHDLGPRALVTLIENAIIELLNSYQLDAYSSKKAPGVYIDNKKIAALGLRISKGYSTHGLSLNIDMDLTPFNLINPCGYEGMEVTQLKHFEQDINFTSVQDKLLTILIDKLAKS